MAPLLAGGESQYRSADCASWKRAFGCSSCRQCLVDRDRSVFQVTSLYYITLIQAFICGLITQIQIVIDFSAYSFVTITYTVGSIEMSYSITTLKVLERVPSLYVEPERLDRRGFYQSHGLYLLYRQSRRTSHLQDSRCLYRRVGSGVRQIAQSSIARVY